MAISRVKTWSSGEVLTASDLNAEYNNILNNASDLVSPFTKAISMGGFALNFDAANTMSLVSSTKGLNLSSTTAINDVFTTVASATTPDIWTAVGGVVNYTGVVTATGFAAAPQAGARRTLVCAGAAPFTAGANVLIDGFLSGATYTAAAGDKVHIIAVTTTQFRLTPALVTQTLTNPVNTTQALTDAASVAWDMSLGGTATLLATGAVGATRAMAAPSNIKTGGRYVLHFTQDGTGGRALTFNAVFKNQGDAATLPAPSQAANAVTAYVFESPDGTNLRLTNYYKKPSRQVFTSGTAATYTTPAGVTRINVRMVGGGAGGGGATANNGTAGNTTTFSGSTLSAAGGSAGLAAAAGQSAGGAGTNGDINITGGGGQGGEANSVANVNPQGGQGGGSAFGGGGSGGAGGQAGQVGGLNSGGGGGGGGGASTTSSGGGGGAGAYVEKLIVSPAATYTYTVGAAANGGAAGGAAGGNGAAGIIIVDEWYD